jgi:rare lipoprotein A
MRLRGALSQLILLVMLSSMATAGLAAAASNPEKRHSEAKSSKPDRKTAKSGTTTRTQKANQQKQIAAKSDRPDRAKQQNPVARTSAQREERRDRDHASNERERRDRVASDSDRSAARLNAEERQQLASGAPPDRYVGRTRDIGALKVVGHRETGRAAWYGGRHVGQRTASGDVLDSTRPTAAHRSLPLNSLARVTNLNNGRSVVVEVTDRGPRGGGRLIDVSPRAAEELDMKRDGVVPVAIEPVAGVRQAAAAN